MSAWERPSNLASAPSAPSAGRRVRAALTGVVVSGLALLSTGLLAPAVAVADGPPPAQVSTTLQKASTCPAAQTIPSRPTLGNGAQGTMLVTLAGAGVEHVASVLVDGVTLSRSSGSTFSTGQASVAVLLARTVTVVAQKDEFQTPYDVTAVKATFTGGVACLVSSKLIIIDDGRGGAEAVQSLYLSGEVTASTGAVFSAYVHVNGLTATRPLTGTEVVVRQKVAGWDGRATANGGLVASNGWKTFSTSATAIRSGVTGGAGITTLGAAPDLADGGSATPAPATGGQTPSVPSSSGGGVTVAGGSPGPAVPVPAVTPSSTDDAPSAGGEVVALAQQGPCASGADGRDRRGMELSCQRQRALTSAAPYAGTAVSAVPEPGSGAVLPVTLGLVLLAALATLGFVIHRRRGAAA